MAVTTNFNKETQLFLGLSTDTKPTNACVGATFTEYDTGNIYEFNNATWELKEKEAPIWLVDTTTTLNGVFTVIEAYGDCTFTTLTSNMTKGGTVTPLTVSDIATLSDGKRLYGVFTSVRLASGKCICYR